MIVKPISETEFNSMLGAKLRQIREGAKLSQPELAERLHVHPNTVSNWERGQGIMTVLFLKICVIAGVNAGGVLAAVMNEGKARANDASTRN